jgi:hypothetical protein
MLSDLAARLGFGAQGASPGVLRTNLVNIFQQSQTTLYWTHDWARLRRYTTVTVGQNQYLVDYPDDCNPERIKALSILNGNVWGPPLRKGIHPELYTTQNNGGPPYRWEPYEQIELWPRANQEYSLRIFYVKNLDPLSLDSHRTTIDSDLVYTLALADAKAHYRHPDAPSFQTRAEAMLSRLKAKSWGKDVFHPNDYHDDPLPKPVVVED